jgi:hypothetical protein
MEILLYTPEQLKEWKAKYKRLKLFTFTDAQTKKQMCCVLRNPTQAEIGLAVINAKKNPMSFNSTIIKSCWLVGDEAIQDNDDAMQYIGEELESLVKEGSIEVKNL